jgi:hypothetical protein
MSVNCWGTVVAIGGRATVIAAWILGAALWIPAAIGAEMSLNEPGNTSGAMPADDTLTCEQIYAQGMAESQREQEERKSRNEQRRRELQGTAALLIAGSTIGRLDPSQMTARAANKAAEGQADKAMAELGGAPQSNPRMAHLKQLWAQKQCVMK